MAMNISVRTPQDSSDLWSLYDFVLSQHLDYPNYEDWAYRAKTEIEEGYKIAIVAWSEGKIVGNVIFQPHKQFARIRELKNLRVSVKSRFRKFGAFLLRQAEWFQFEDYDFLFGDFRSDNNAMQRLLVSEGYEIKSLQSLYDPNVLDSVVIKPNLFTSVSQRLRNGG